MALTFESGTWRLWFISSSVWSGGFSPNAVSFSPWAFTGVVNSLPLNLRRFPVETLNSLVPSSFFPSSLPSWESVIINFSLFSLFPSVAPFEGAILFASSFSFGFSLGFSFFSVSTSPLTRDSPCCPFCSFALLIFSPELFSSSEGSDSSDGDFLFWVLGGMVSFIGLLLVSSLLGLWSSFSSRVLSNFVYFGWVFGSNSFTKGVWKIIVQ